MVRAVFKNMIIAAAGAFPSDCPSEHAAKEWTEQRGGRFSSDLDDSVTHLICTDEDFKIKYKQIRIKEAERRNRRKGSKKIRILSWDWFRFSCTRNRRLRIRDYDFSAMRTKENERMRKFRAAALAYKWIHPDLFRIWKDKSSFEYKVDLFRTSEDEDGALHEKYELYLFESHASKPHMYWFGAKLFHKKDDGKWHERGIERPNISSSLFKTEYARFRKFFELKTGIRWEDRVIKAGTREKILFSYSPPTDGKPVGGKMTGALYDKCVSSNRAWLRRWTDLFGDELPLDIQIGDECKNILNGIIDRVCASLEMDTKVEDECKDILNSITDEVCASLEMEAKEEESLYENDTYNSEIDKHGTADALLDLVGMGRSAPDFKDNDMESYVENL
ncbi:hypothetical protein CORC01_08619 [Colletotrichum orchidophilum]|uniref:BRCT domain-containing protein n=1 Tax=Colletotrichum orchidophilum TaxID=1209926 RepID=A0A1G4B485_9PEZI|nr:uncharacterized protein CORC01_08619 [Colletotrichum orchidophilum]OHE96082.1 hypothetical protein CORC01_08619 [Colletotrichum orchidophilum]